MPVEDVKRGFASALRPCDPRDAAVDFMPGTHGKQPEE
jgi:hypothetical protein